jgi:aspartate kinase
MPLIIQKYGGKALASPADIQQVARLIFERHNSGVQLVIVVSAMGDTTDRYLSLARSVNPHAAGRELDVLLSVGERISIAMLALALNALEAGLAVSLTGAQAGIITDTVHTAANIVEIRPLRVREILDQGKIPVIAGYQGITIDKNISTLGRGGTDATAVALAVALGAERVEFMKDVDGVQSANPKLIPVARVIPELRYIDALEMMGCGAKILQVPAVELASEHNVPLVVGNSRTGVQGTIISEKPLLQRTLMAVVLEPNVHLLSFASNTAILKVIRELGQCGCTPLLTVSSQQEHVIVVKREEAQRLGLEEPEHQLHPSSLIPHPLSLVTLIGPGVGGHGDLAHAVQERLAPYKDLLAALSLTESRLSVLLPETQAQNFATVAHELCLTGHAYG